MSFLHSTPEAIQFIVCYIYTYEYFHYNKLKTVEQGIGVPVWMKKHLSITLYDLKIAKNQPLFNQLIPFAQDDSLKCCSYFVDTLYLYHTNFDISFIKKRCPK